MSSVYVSELSVIKKNRNGRVGNITEVPTSTIILSESTLNLLKHLTFDPVSNTIVADVGMSVIGGLNVAAIIDSVKLSDSNISSHPEWVLSTITSFIVQSTGEYTIVFNALLNNASTTYPNVSLSLFAKVNTGLFVDCVKAVNFTGASTPFGVSGILPLAVTWNDVVYFELR